MTKKEEQFARLIGGLDVNAEPNSEHREQLREQMLSDFGDASREHTTLRSTWPSHRGIGYTENAVVSYWRTLMSSRLSRYAAVAAVAAAIILGLTFIEGKDKKAGKAWAIEQTIQALQNVRTVYLSGIMNTTHLNDSTIPEGKVVPVSFELWARTDDPSRGQDAHLDGSAAGQSIILVRHDNVVYRYLPGQNTVYIQDANTFTATMDPWPGPDYFQNLKSNSTTWQEEYGKDEVTGRDSVFVKCASSIGSYWLQFDVESKLPVRAKCWYSNKKWEGEPTVASEHIVYNPEIPDDKFDFKIPPGAKVIDQRKATKKDEVKK